MNFLAYTRASKIEYDAWTFFSSGQNDWSWDGLLPYFKKSTSVNPDQTNDFLGIPGGEDPNDHDEGFDGPIHVSQSLIVRKCAHFLFKVSHNTLFSDAEPLYAKAMISIGIPMNEDPVSLRPRFVLVD